MPTIKTVKPDGTGDFTTLQAWNDWAKMQDSAEQWAECYKGNIGKLTSTSWTTPPTVNSYPRIYTPLSERHNGTSGSGSYISFTSGQCFTTVNLPYMEIDGLSFINTGTSYGLSAVSAVAIGVTVKNCAFFKCNCLFFAKLLTTLIIRFNAYNNLISLGRLAVEHSVISGGTGNTFIAYVNCYNNVVYNTVVDAGVPQSAIHFSGNIMKTTASDVITYVNLYNNVASPSYTTLLTGSPSAGSGNIITGSNNLSADTTADHICGSFFPLQQTEDEPVDNIINMPIDKVVIDPVRNLNKKATSPAKGAGVYLEDNTTAYNGKARKNPPDMGADEQDTKWIIKDTGIKDTEI